jgi:hypothetical protein
MMPHYRGMSRGLCSVSGSFGTGLGHACLLLRFRPAPDAAAALRDWLLGTALPSLSALPGIGSAHLFESALTPTMTAEQRIRGGDIPFDWAVLVTGYREAALDALGQSVLSARALAERGVPACAYGYHRLDYAVLRSDVHG